ncbi:hypothetical protein GCM10028819_24400 [Spirosoma humi]
MFALRHQSDAGLLKAVHPTDGDPIEPGYIYLAPPDHHLLVEKDRVLVKKGPKENRFRPSIDALFRSAAYTFGSRVVGVVLTGLLKKNRLFCLKNRAKHRPGVATLQITFQGITSIFSVPMWFIFFSLSYHFQQCPKVRNHFLFGLYQ